MLRYQYSVRYYKVIGCNGIIVVLFRILPIAINKLISAVLSSKDLKTAENILKFGYFYFGFLLCFINIEILKVIVDSSQGPV